MLAVSSSSIKDLRSRAIDQKRYTESKHKWNPKWAQIAHPAPVVKFGPKDTQRPIRKSKTHCVSPDEHNARGKALERTKAGKKQDPLGTSEDRSVQQKTLKRAHRERKREREALDRSTELNSIPSSVLQSFHENGGERSLTGEDYPATGNTVFEVAINKAVERYEDMSLLKLVKEEYEVLEPIDEDSSPLEHTEDSDLDDGFEFV